MAFPEGSYDQVYVVNPLGGNGSLRNGTGTASETGVFSCGNFDKLDYPDRNTKYKITAHQVTHNGDGKQYEELMTCVTTDHQTCDFK